MVKNSKQSRKSPRRTNHASKSVSVKGLIVLVLASGVPVLLLAMVSREMSHHNSNQMKAFDAPIDEPVDEPISDTNSTGPTTTVIFYNIYTANKKEIPRVQSIVEEQLALVRPGHTETFVTMIGANFTIPNTTLLGHFQEGSEMLTLHSLWNYCKQHPAHNVIYIHSKGSFHPRLKNDILRRYLTRGVLSQECLDMPDYCDLCSSRISPAPHPHISGNMWLARCSYVQNMMDPSKFEKAMSTAINLEVVGPHCVGLERYAAEHWIHSHPRARPCDLDPRPGFVWEYKGIRDRDFQKVLMPAPRFDLPIYARPKTYRICGWTSGSMEHRIFEYKALYNMTPDSTWWGWEYYNQGRYTL